jgi:hypothetical protein
MHMNVRKALVAMAAAAALVAAPVLAASPAQAAPEKAGGTTLISFKKEYAGIVKLISPVKPAKFIDSKFTFPVTGVNGDEVLHSGGIKISNTKFMDPILTVNADKKRATITMTFEDGRIPVFYAKHFKIKADGVGGQVWQGNLHVTNNKTVVETLNQLLGVDSLTPGLGLGQIRVTIKK